MVARLTVWRGVIPEDIGSMTDMKNALETNADLYKSLMFEEVKGMDRGPALSALMLLQSYYCLLYTSMSSGLNSPSNIFR